MNKKIMLYIFGVFFGAVVLLFEFGISKGLSLISGIILLSSSITMILITAGIDSDKKNREV